MQRIICIQCFQIKCKPLIYYVCGVYFYDVTNFTVNYYYRSGVVLSTFEVLVIILSHYYSMTYSLALIWHLTVVKLPVSCIQMLH